MKEDNENIIKDEPGNDIKQLTVKLDRETADIFKYTCVVLGVQLGETVEGLIKDFIRQSKAEVELKLSERSNDI